MTDSLVNPLAPHQLRVVAEKQELDDKIAKLTEFIDGPIMPTADRDEQHRLIEQRGHMQAYSGVLERRISAFTK